MVWSPPSKAEMTDQKISFARDPQFRLEYALLRTIVGLVRLLPLETATGISARAWRALAPRINPKRHKRALANIAMAYPDMPDEERLRICMAHWENLGRVMAETMQIDRLIEDPDRIRIVSDRLFSRYKDKLGPAIGVSLHMGNWELSIWPFVVAHANPAAVYHSVEQKAVA